MTDSNDTKECPGCALEVDADAEICPYCGYEFPKQPLAIKIAAWFFLFLLLFWYFFL